MDNNHTFTVFAINFDPKVRAFVKVDGDGGNVAYPPIYNNQDDMMQLAEELHIFIQELVSVGTPTQSKWSCNISFGPGVAPFEMLNPLNVTDVYNYVNSWGPFDGSVWWSHLGINHFGGSAPLSPPSNSGSHFGVRTDTVAVSGVTNVHVVDASLFPQPVVAHPMATVLAVAAKCADVLKRILG